MITRYRVALDGVDLDSLADEIIIKDVSEEEETAIEAVDSPFIGQRLISLNRKSLTVNVEFEIHTQDIKRREEIAEMVRDWATKGGMKQQLLTTNSKEGKEIFVICEKAPTVLSALRWIDELKISFKAFFFPFWEEIDQTTATVSTGGKTSLIVAGNGEKCYCTASITCNSGTITELSLKIGDCVMNFEGLQLANGKKLEISYNAEKVISMKIGSTSVMYKRTPESSDDLAVRAGAHDVTLTAKGGTATATIKARGAWM